MRTYRDHARAVRGVTEPEMVLPTTAHAAFAALTKNNNGTEIIDGTASYTGATTRYEIALERGGNWAAACLISAGAGKSPWAGTCGRAR